MSKRPRSTSLGRVSFCCKRSGRESPSLPDFKEQIPKASQGSESEPQKQGVDHSRTSGIEEEPTWSSAATPMCSSHSPYPGYTKMEVEGVSVLETSKAASYSNKYLLCCLKNYLYIVFHFY